MFKYSVTVKWSDEDKGFIAVVPELEGLSAFGETQSEAIQELMVAAEAYMEALEESGQHVPAPNKLMSYSGQLRLRMPKWLHAKLATEAENEGISLNTHLVALLANRQGEKKAVDAIRRDINALRNFYVTPSHERTGYFSLLKSEPKGVSLSNGYYSTGGVH